jgi:hypothetical protein
MKPGQKTLRQIKSVWSAAGLHEAPRTDDVADNVQRVRKLSPRSPRVGGRIVGIRLTANEKKRLQKLAFDQEISLGEVVSRLLALYEEKHGPIL